MGHKNICYDGERLECVCGLRGDADIQQSEQISRAELEADLICGCLSMPKEAK
jgi:hypothetical protein